MQYCLENEMKRIDQNKKRKCLSDVNIWKKEISRKYANPCLPFTSENLAYEFYKSKFSRKLERGLEKN